MDDNDLQKIRFDFIQSRAYRVIHVDGATASVTPDGHAFISLWNEHVPAPDRVVHDVVDGQLGNERRDERVATDAIIREIDVGLMLDHNTLHGLHALLGELLTRLKAKQGQSDVATKGDS